jgi:hypothetical protein
MGIQSYLVRYDSTKLAENVRRGLICYEFTLGERLDDLNLKLPIIRCIQFSLLSLTWTNKSTKHSKALSNGNLQS